MKNSIIAFISIIVFVSCEKKTIETQPVIKNITETVFASGTLEPVFKYNLTAQSEGYLIEMNFKEGDLVKTGFALARIDNKQNEFNSSASDKLLKIAKNNVSDNAPALKQMEENIRVAENKLQQDQLQAERFRQLYESKSVSKLELENMELIYKNSKANYDALQQNYDFLKTQAEQQLINQQAQKNVNDYLAANNVLKAVVGGKVYKKNKETGDYVRRGDIIAVIGHPTDFYARLTIDEGNISKVKIGQKTTIQLNTNTEKNYEAEISEILPAFDEMSQSFVAKAKFTTEPELKILGTQLQSNIYTGSKANALVIPRNYLGYGNKVKVKDKKEPVVVSTGFVSTEWAEITKGLSVNDVIVTDKLK